MTRLLFLAIGILIGITFARWQCKRRTVQAVAPANEDRFDFAGLEDRMKQYDAEYNLERKRGKP